MRQMRGITRRLVDARIQAVGYDEEAGSVVNMLDTGGKLLVSAGFDGFHVIVCETLQPPITNEHDFALGT